MRLVSILSSLAIAASFFALPANAETFPSRPVKVIVPFAAGGPVDVLARAVGESFRERTGQSLVVENKPGGNTSIGAAACKSAEPDGYTICFLTSSTITLNPFLYKSLPYDAEKDLEPVTNLVIGRQVLMISTSVDVKTFADLVALSKQQPDKLSFASFGTGGDSHLVVEWLAKKTGLKVLHVPYQGAAPALLAFERGEVQLMLPISTEPVLERIRSGKARGLLVTGSKRDPNLPEVPTIQDVGVEPIGYETWFGSFAPANTPRDRIDTLSKIIGDIVRSDSFRSKYVTAGYDAVGNSAADFKKAISAERVHSKNLIDISGVKIAQ